MTSRIPYRNKSPFGWWVASYLERLEWSHEDRRNPKRRCLAWENTVLVQAPTRQSAWKKTIALGRLSSGTAVHDDKGRKGVWRFEGLTELLPVYEQLEDGAEILWQEHRGRTVASIRAMVRTRMQLNSFDDRNLRPASHKAKA